MHQQRLLMSARKKVTATGWLPIWNCSARWKGNENHAVFIVLIILIIVVQLWLNHYTRGSSTIFRFEKSSGGIVVWNSYHVPWAYFTACKWMKKMNYKYAWKCSKITISRSSSSYAHHMVNYLQCEAIFHACKNHANTCPCRAENSTDRSSNDDRRGNNEQKQVEEACNRHLMKFTYW